MRKLAASLMVFTFVAAALVSSFFGGSPSSAQDAPLLTQAPSHTPMVTPLAMLNSDFEGGTDEQGQPFGWNNAGVNKRDRVKCAKGGTIGIVPPPERCHFMFKGAEGGKVSVLRQDIPIVRDFQPGQPIEIVARIGGKNLAGNTFTVEGILYYTDFSARVGKIRVSHEVDFVTNDEIHYLSPTTKLETLDAQMNPVWPFWLRLKLKYRGTSGWLVVGGVKANALIPSPTPLPSKTPLGQPTPPCACEPESRRLESRIHPTRTPFSQPTRLPISGGE